MGKTYFWFLLCIPHSSNHIQESSIGAQSPCRIAVYEPNLIHIYWDVNLVDFNEHWIVIFVRGALTTALILLEKGTVHLIRENTFNSYIDYAL